MGVWGNPATKLSYSLCNTCARAVPQECLWIDKGIRAGLQYENKYISSGYGDKNFEIVSIIDCPNYINGPPPGLGEKLNIEGRDKSVVPKLQLVKKVCKDHGLIIADNIDLKIEDIVGCFVSVLGVRGSGKSNTAATIIEELLDKNFPLAILDIDAEYLGLKERYEILVIGKGSEADIEIRPEQAGDIAEISVLQRVPVLIDLSKYEKDEQVSLIENYLERLWEVEQTARMPYQILVEEAHEWIPEKSKHPLKDVLTRIALRGRKRGLGAILVSQRSAKVSKDVLSQAEMYFLHKVTHPADVNLYRQLLSWPLKKVENDVKKLDTGEVIYSFKDQIQRSKCRKRFTSHGGSTPKFSQITGENNKLGQVVVQVKKLLEREEVGSVDAAASNFTGELDHSFPDVKGPQDLTKEDYLLLKEKGLTNKQIMNQYGFKSTGSFYYALEKLGAHQKGKGKTEVNNVINTEKDSVNVLATAQERGSPKSSLLKMVYEDRDLINGSSQKQDHQDSVTYRTGNIITSISDICKILYPNGVQPERLNDYNLIFLVVSKICKLVDSNDSELHGLIWKEIEALGSLGYDNR